MFGFVYFEVAEESRLVAASNADAEVTESVVPGEAISPSNAQLQPMVLPSTLTDNASTLASLRMVSYTEGFQFMYPTILCVFSFDISVLDVSQIKLSASFPRDGTKTSLFVLHRVICTNQMMP